MSVPAPESQPVPILCVTAYDLYFPRVRNPVVGGTGVPLLEAVVTPNELMQKRAAGPAWLFGMPLWTAMEYLMGQCHAGFQTNPV